MYYCTPKALYNLFYEVIWDTAILKENKYMTYKCDGIIERTLQIDQLKCARKMCSCIQKLTFF